MFPVVCTKHIAYKAYPFSHQSLHIGLLSFLLHIGLLSFLLHIGLLYFLLPIGLLSF